MPCARTRAALAIIAAALFAADAAEARDQRDRPCLPCHTAGAHERAPQIDLADFDDSSHGEESCVACHDDVENPDIEHEKEDQDLAPVACGNCHQAPAAEYATSVHGVAQHDRGEASEAARCVDCHSSHSIRRADDPRSSTFARTLPATCGKCHADEGVVQRHQISLPDAYQQYAAGVHGKSGLMLAASCNDCHGTHDIAHKEDERSTINRNNVVDTCGQCHADISHAFKGSIHATSPKAAAGAGPVCTSCHSSHGVTEPHGDNFRAAVVAECGTCHERLMATYRGTYHGQATTLGDTGAARCSDCHGAHAIRAPGDPLSSVHPANKLATCRECHEGAPVGFELYWAHPDHSNSDKYPLLHFMWLAMTSLLISVFVLFGIHTILWWIRGTIERRRAIKAGRAPAHSHGNGDVAIRRFPKYHRVTHAFVVISFLGLAVTGAPLKYADAEWSHYVFAVLGGVQTAGWLHRLFAVITFGYFFAHVAFIFGALRRARKRNQDLIKTLFGPDSPVPNWGDVKDIAAHFRYFIGRGPKPTWDHWTYWEKFDYWAVFWGVAVIGMSGLVLWFPEFAAQILPGWAVNIAFLIHADEALLAMGFIFAIHFFNGHLRHDKFPLDTVIFTGVVTEEEFKEERGREWERLVAEGKFDELRTTVPTPESLRWIRVVGISAWLFGTLLLGLIVYAQFFD